MGGWYANVTFWVLLTVKLETPLVGGVPGDSRKQGGKSLAFQDDDLRH